ncbi:MAG TPA: hypothetical protein VMM12_01860 [Longimicrobiales bacterium]|nr:hypothetical protein [Longimicrobiales bacterium]
MRHWLALLLIASAAACGDGGADVDFGGADVGEDRFAIRSADGAVRLALTDDVVYFALTDSVLAEARADILEVGGRDAAAPERAAHPGEVT